MLTYSFLIIRLRIYKILREIQIKRIKISSAIFLNKHSDRKRSAHSGLDRKSGFAKTDNVRRIRNRTRLFPNRIESGHVSTAPVRITNSGIRLPLSAHCHCLRRIVSDASFSTALQTHRPSRILTVHEKNSSADRTKFRKKPIKSRHGIHRVSSTLKYSVSVRPSR